MIRDGVVYECVDGRENELSMDGITMLFPVADGYEVRNLSGLVERFEFEDDDQLEEKNDVSTFHMPEGKLHFVELTLPDFERFEGESLLGTPKFKDTATLQNYFRSRIENDY